MLTRLTRLFETPVRTPRHRSAGLRCEALEAREVPAGLFFAGVGGVTQTADPEVSIYATVGPNANQRLGIQLEAFSSATGDTRIALGDVNGDGTDDIIAAAGKGGGSEVVIFDGAAALRGTRTSLARFFVYSNATGVSQTRGFDGGVFVAAADLNQDGFAELITTPGAGGRGHLKAFDFNDGTGRFLGSTPTVRASAYTFTDYDGEIRVTTLRVLDTQYVVTASGAGVPGDVRGYQNIYNLGSVADRTPVPNGFQITRLVPFGGYTGGLSVAGGDTNGDGDDELFVSKNSGPSTVEVYRATDIARANDVGNFSPAPLATFEAFAGFQGEVRLGAADVDGDGKVEVLTTTGFSGDPQGTPVKAFARSGSAFSLARSFYSNPGYQPGAWLPGKDFTFATDLTAFTVRGAAGLPATFSYAASNPDATLTVGSDVDLLFPSTGRLPAEGVTGAGLPFKDVEVTFAFTHPIPDEVTVTLLYLDGSAANNRSFVLYRGPGTGRNELFSGMAVTITDNASGAIPAGAAGTLTGRFQADDGSLADFIRSLPTRNGRAFSILFEDSVNQDNGTVTSAVTPKIRLLY